MTLGQRIKECRQKAGLSQEKVAELVGVSRQAVTKWESDQSAPNTDNLFKLAKILGTTVDFLISTESDTASVAEQVYQMFKEDEAQKEAARLARQRHRIQYTLITALGYLAVFLLGKIFWYTGSDASIMGWLFGTGPREHAYLFGWLIGNQLYLYASLISIFCAALGWHRTAITSLAGFALGLPLGEYLGSIPGLVPSGYHYGWAIWSAVFLISLGMGIWLQRFSAEDLSFRSKKLRMWCILFAVLVIGSIAIILLNIPPAYY